MGFYPVRLQKLRVQAQTSTLGPGSNDLPRANLGSGWDNNIHCSKPGSDSGLCEKQQERGKLTLNSWERTWVEERKNRGQTLKGNLEWEERGCSIQLRKFLSKKLWSLPFLLFPLGSLLECHSVGWGLPITQCKNNSSPLPTFSILPICLTLLHVPHSTYWFTNTP